MIPEPDDLNQALHDAAAYFADDGPAWWEREHAAEDAERDGRNRFEGGYDDCADTEDKS